MIRNFRTAPACLALVALLAAPLARAQDDAQALALRALAATCGTCHGTDGRALPDAAVPGLAGVPASQIVERFKAFRSGERPSTVMQQIAKGYSDAQLEQLARWFAEQKR